MRAPVRGKAAFPVILSGETVSLLGSQLSGYAVSLHAFAVTHTVTTYALLSLAAVLPGLLVAPFAGQVVDRLPRRRVMVAGNLLQASGTAVVAGLGLWGHLELWEVGVLSAINSVIAAFHLLAFEASTTLLVPPQHLARASGAQQGGQAFAQLVAPAAAAALLGAVGLSGVLVLDAASFAVALAAVAFTAVPELGAPPAREEASLRLGARFLAGEPGLVGTLAVQGAITFALAMTTVLLLPLVLSLASAAAFGGVLSAAGVGMLVGSALMAVWGGPHRRMAGIWLGGGTMAVALLAGGLCHTALGLGACAFVVGLGNPLVNAGAQALWQTRVPPEVQGRVFAVRRMVLGSALPVALVLAGPLADRVFEPAMASGGALAGVLGPLFGVGAGRGVAALLSSLGVLTLLATAASTAPVMRALDQPTPRPVQAGALDFADAGAGAREHS